MPRGYAHIAGNRFPGTMNMGCMGNVTGNIRMKGGIAIFTKNKQARKPTALAVWMRAY